MATLFKIENYHIFIETLYCSGSGHLSDEAHKRLKVVNDDITYQVCDK